MTVSKITISLPAELVQELDAVAEASGESRSLILREAAAEYLANAEKRTADAQREQRRASAWEALAALRAMPPADTRSSAEILASLRAEAVGER